MLRTTLHSITVRSLDYVTEKARGSDRAAVRTAGAVLDRFRGLVGLDRVHVRSPIPPWDGGVPDQHMWPSDRDKLHKWQIDQGILKVDGERAANAQAAAPAEPVVKVYFKRGCPYTRAAMDLLREREIPFREFDYTMDKALHGWVKNVTGRKTSPQIFIHDQPIGGFDELRELDHAGELLERIATPPPPEVDEFAATADDADEEPGEISAQEVRERLEDGAELLLLDVREPAECRAGVLPGAIMIPLGELDARSEELDAAGVWIVYCRSGARSSAAQARLLKQHGFASVLNLQGGIEAWRAAKGPLVSPDEARAAAEARADKRASATVKASPRRLPVLGSTHPERSPFEEAAQLQAHERGELDAPRLEGAELVERVRSVIDDCRPLVQADGGDIELLDVQGDIVSVALTGNCIGCPSAQATLRHGIERRLMQQIPQIKGIRSPQLGAG